MKKMNCYYIEQDRYGNIIINNNYDNRTVFFQFQSDTDAVISLLKKSEKSELYKGYAVKIKFNEPRASIIEEYFNNN